MKLVERFFRKKSHNMSDEYREIVWLENFFDDLLDENKYIPRSSYLHILEEKKRVIHYFAVLSDSGMLKKYCRKNGINFEQVLRVTDIYENIEVYAARCNELFLRKELEREKLYLDTILTEVDSNIMLDEDQRRVVLTDEDYCLVVAGAGTGKTTTVAAKVKYLVEKKDVAPSQILIVSFTNKAVKELKDKINKELGIVSPISTFHAVGNAIIHINMPDEPLHIVDNSKLYYVLRDYFRNTMMKKESVVNSLILFFASYFDAPYEGEDLNKFFHQIAKANFSTMRSDLEDFRREVIDQKTKKKITIQNEVLRSFEEVEIANFLYLNNIDYEYEPIYPYNILYARKPYTPDFLIVQGDKKIYIEHFGITEQGENNRYDKVQLEKYKAAINRKVLLHREHKTELLYTFSSYTDGKSTLEHLQSQLESKGIQLCAKPNQEVMEKLVTGEENRYIRKLLNLVCRFISNFKVNGYVQGDFNRMQYGTKNVRTKLFLEICEDC
ncbi:MAG: UvrD-helicase domain-containing protein, partial [Eubacteriales bacterium]